MSDLKILHVAPNLAQGGAERVLHLLLTSRRDGLSHALMLMADDVFFNIDGVEKTALGFNLANQPQSMIRLLPAMRSLRHHVAATKPDVVVGWLYYGAFLTLSLARSSVPIVWSIHNTSFPPIAAKPVLYAIDRVLAAASRNLPDRIIYCAATARSVHVARSYYNAEGVVVHNGVDTTDFVADASSRRHQRNSLGLTEDHVAVALCCRFDEQKNIPMALDAFARFAAETPGAVLLLVGRGMDRMNVVLAALIASRQLTHRCHLLGPVRDVATFMRGADVVMLASSYGEAMPMVLLEALATQTPIAATRIGDIAQLPVPSQALAEAGDVAGLATSLRFSYDTRHSAAWQVAFDAVRRDFTLAQTVDGYAAVFRGLVTIQTKPDEGHR